MFEVIKGANVTNEKVLIGPKRIPKNESEERSQRDPIESAKEESEKILREAMKKAEEIISQAENKAKSIEENAQKKGYASGLEIGKKELENEVKRAKEIVNLMEENADSMIDSVRNSLIDLIIATVKETVLLELNKGDLEKKIDRALEAVKSSKKIVIKVPNDTPSIIVEKLASTDKIQVLPISTLEKMDVQIEADFGTLDLRVASQLELFERLVRKAFGNES